MASKKANDGPAVQMKSQPQVVTVTVPVVEPASVPVEIQINVRLRGPQAAEFIRMYQGLRAVNAVLDSGHHVDNVADVLRWLTEEAARRRS